MNTGHPSQIEGRATSRARLSLLALLILLLPWHARAVPIDVFVILDESGSWSAAEFAKQKEFIQAFGQSLTFGISGTNSANAGIAVMAARDQRGIPERDCREVRGFSPGGELSRSGVGSSP